MLAYTFNKLLVQQAVIERDMSGLDAYGGEEPPFWRPHLTVPCLLHWAPSHGGRSVNQEYASPQRVVPLSEGGLIVALGTDVTEDDRIVRILKREPISGDWVLDIDGVFTIVAVLTHPTHVECSVVRPHLGA